MVWGEVGGGGERGLGFVGRVENGLEGLHIVYLFVVPFGEFITGSSKRLQSLMSMKGQNGQQVFSEMSLFSM